MHLKAEQSQENWNTKPNKFVQFVRLSLVQVDFRFSEPKTQQYLVWPDLGSVGRKASSNKTQQNIQIEPTHIIALAVYLNDSGLTKCVRVALNYTKSVPSINFIFSLTTTLPLPQLKKLLFLPPHPFIFYYYLFSSISRS